MGTFFTGDPNEHNDLASLIGIGAGLVVITALPATARIGPAGAVFLALAAPLFVLVAGMYVVGALR